MKTTDLTPVEIHNKIYYKRDDYYTPYGKENVNGGKTRQAICLFRELKDEIKNKLPNFKEEGVYNFMGNFGNVLLKNNRL